MPEPQEIPIVIFAQGALPYGVMLGNEARSGRKDDHESPFGRAWKPWPVMINVVMPADGSR
jgi:hypothetical protein